MAVAKEISVDGATEAGFVFFSAFGRHFPQWKLHVKQKESRSVDILVRFLFFLPTGF